MKNENEQQTDMQHARQLPTFMGYTVDERLREFRKVDHATMGIEFIPFESVKGQKILKKYIYHKYEAIVLI